ncbi:MAG: DeoR/GlpR family DNA-binding transcription regulator [Verrucomicrobiota bacterium JB025]|nr:DeoR/GlpR family DNA-binding transcription regulator [Verrucomicrobiota bacterium JB025]
MLAIERQQQILTLLDERGTVRTVDLAEEFQVTNETIRRDLQALEEASQLTRIHGGASSLNGRPKLQSFTERQGLEVQAKREIAQAALEMIQPGRTYAFDSSTTAFELVALLPDLPYRVVTNAYGVLEQMVRMEKVQLICTGGRYHPKTQTFVGGESIDTLRRHNVQTAFISCVGFDIERGASEGFEQQATFKGRLVQFAEEVILLVDSTKFLERSEYFFAESVRISRIITDRGIAPAVADAIRAKGIKLTIAD